MEMIRRENARDAERLGFHPGIAQALHVAVLQAEMYADGGFHYVSSVECDRPSVCANCYVLKLLFIIARRFVETHAQKQKSRPQRRGADGRVNKRLQAGSRYLLRVYLRQRLFPYRTHINQWESVVI